jgi:tRNA-specific 2-thiouridylase
MNADQQQPSTELNSLGIAKAPADTRVVVAMSGGVDSSVVAALLHEEGYDVVGVTLQLYDHGEALKKKGACCAGQDIYDARRVSESCGFPHYVLDYESKFKESVIDDFADSYLKGQTPIPCVRCNQTVKFRDLLEVAHDLGADCMATGHYIQREVTEDGKARLLRAHDHGKDQSYFLFATTQEQLNFLRFPLGGWEKDKTREHAERLGLITADKPDSQDICFVPQGNYADVVRKIRPEGDNPGDIIDMAGNVVGQHKGIINYTIGQRRGIGIGGGVSEDNSPFYVIRLNPAENQVIVGPKEALARDTIYINDCNWLNDFKAGETVRVQVKLRSVSKPYTATATLDPDNSTRAIITLDDAQYGIATGQAAVCYSLPENNDNSDKPKTYVLGGGWIYDTANSALNEAAAA